MEVTVLANMTATVYVLVAAVYEVGSGVYCFTSVLLEIAK